MDRLVPSTTCRCGYASPPTLLRCLGCGRRFAARCERPATGRSPRPVAPPRTGARRDGRRPERLTPPGPIRGTTASPAAGGAAAVPAGPAGASTVPFGPVAVLGLVAAAWIEPDAPRVELLTAAAIVGAGLAALRPAAPAPSTSRSAGAPATARRDRLTDDELRDALAAW